MDWLKQLLEKKEMILRNAWRSSLKKNTFGYMNQEIIPIVINGDTFLQELVDPS